MRLFYLESIDGPGVVSFSQCADEKSNESVEDMDGTLAGW